jgi:hypothetical protein
MYVELTTVSASLLPGPRPFIADLRKTVKKLYQLISNREIINELTSLTDGSLTTPHSMPFPLSFRNSFETFTKTLEHIEDAKLLLSDRSFFAV